MTVGNAGIDDSPTFDDDTLLLQLSVDFIQYHIIKVGLYKNVTETTHRRAVRGSIFQSQSDKAAERQTVVHLLLNLTVTKSIPSTEEFGLEQHKLFPLV